MKLTEHLKRQAMIADKGHDKRGRQPNLVLSPFRIEPICICVHSAVVQPGQVFEGIHRQLFLRNAQFMLQLPHRCMLQVHS